MDFTNFLVRKCPPSAMYIPNFITFDEEKRILSHIERAPTPKWTQLLNRRLMNYGGVPHPNGMISEEIPPWLQAYVDRINNLGIFESKKANHVLVNEYLAGQGIMPHTDGPLFSPIITTISCRSHTVLEFTECQSSSSTTEVNTSAKNARYKLLLEPRSLLILKETLYTDYLHSIRECSEDILCSRICNYENCGTDFKIGDKIPRETRISLTIRNVPKTTKLKLKT